MTAVATAAVGGLLNRCWLFLSSDRALWGFRGLYVAFYAGAFVVYRRAIHNIDNTYTSFKSGVTFGLSNEEKDAARKKCRRKIHTVLARGAAFGLLHWATSSALAVLPLLVSMAHDACVLVEDDDFVDALTGKPPRHPDTIPRSPSGRLM